MYSSKPNHKIKTFPYLLGIIIAITLTSCNKNNKLQSRILKGDPLNSKKVLLLLHGNNSTMDVWKPYTPMIPDNYLVVGARAPYVAEDSTYHWFDADVSKKPAIINNNQLNKSTKRLKALIHALAEEHDIKEKKIIVAGFSQGGTVCYDLAIKHKGLIHNMGIFSGMLPNEEHNWNTIRYPKLNFFISHGKNNKSIKLKSAKMAAFFFQNHEAKVKMEIDDSEHYISKQHFKSFVKWLEKL